VFYTSINRYDYVQIETHLSDALYRNRSKIWDMMTQEERQEYLATTKDKGNKR